MEAQPDQSTSRAGDENDEMDEGVQFHNEDSSNEQAHTDDDFLEDPGDVKFAGPSSGKVVKPLTPEALAAFKAAEERTGVIYISRIPPGMRPAKVRHLMSTYGEVGRIYLQQEDPKRAYLRKKFTSTKKPHFTEGWIEFKDKRVARSVANMLNAQPIGGKKGTRWRDDIWTMKYLPRFKWNMLTEQIAHEAAVHTARLRVELEQSRKEQREYLRQVELARVLNKRAGRKRDAGQEKGTESTTDGSQSYGLKMKRRYEGHDNEGHENLKKSRRTKEDVDRRPADHVNSSELQTILGHVF